MIICISSKMYTELTCLTNFYPSSEHNDLVWVKYHDHIHDPIRTKISTHVSLRSMKRHKIDNINSPSRSIIEFKKFSHNNDKPIRFIRNWGKSYLGI
jgi:hypothetical protein